MLGLPILFDHSFNDNNTYITKGVVINMHVHACKGRIIRLQLI